MATGEGIFSLLRVFSSQHSNKILQKSHLGISEKAHIVVSGCKKRLDAPSSVLEPLKERTVLLKLPVYVPCTSASSQFSLISLKKILSL